MTSIHNPTKKMVNEDKRKENRKQKQREGGEEEEERDYEKEANSFRVRTPGEK